ncbi:PREDICTED: fanconi-associated nuclease 1-like isoform X2 [Vollenhovia emeryi]|nr:PREDICTED: fanconi-associated nuclease 1-like isoform X2 [Vollenhovia emeryi]XP_011861442.1 PREDICTED: fanconi-associated nuclease 1-like isoform X2 [Vollenhovia emeryi]
MKDNANKSNVGSPAVGKTKGGAPDKSGSSSVRKNGKRNSHKMNESRGALQNSVSSGSEASRSLKVDARDSPSKVTEDKTATSPTAKRVSSLGSRRAPAPRGAITPKTSSSMENSPTKVAQASAVTSPITKHASPIASRQRTPTSHSGAKFTPKTVSPIKDALDRSARRAKVARRKLFGDNTKELVSATITNLNLAKEGAIANNDIDLEKVYSSGRFSYNYSPIDTTVPTRYEISDVVVPTDMYSLHLLRAIVVVFSNPINCGYFNQNELDLIYSLMTLPEPAQALFVRILKRKHAWRRISGIKYDRISGDLRPIFDELVSRSIFESNTEEEDISVLLNLLQADEVRKLCQESKINVSGKKNSIRSILEFCRQAKSLFPGMASPASKLRASVNKRLGPCILVNARVREVVDRIITLLKPNRDPAETMVDVFLMLLRIDKDEMKFPEITISDFPIFASKEHLLNYIEAKNTLTSVLSAIEGKQWETVRDLGTLAAQRLPLFLALEESLQELPHHIRHFMPGYMWLKVLYKSIDAFKKTTMTQAIEFLQMLINQNCHMKHRKGQWYGELIKIQMYHMKNIVAGVTLLSDAITCESLTEVDRLDLSDRAELIIKRKSGISKHERATAQQILDKVFSRTQLMPQSSITIIGTLHGNTLQRKNIWCISNSVDQQTYGSVESLALYRYKRDGYIKGVHCEGAFPITLFATLFWEEIYNMNIPGAWVSLYQDAPLDLYSSEFYENRKEQIDTKLQIIRKFDAETLSKHLKHKFELQCDCTSIAQGNIFNDSNSFQEVTFCLGVEGVVGICERLIYNFSLWKAGFPDLIVWNVHTKQYKIVEVKGPSDTLSTKQRLWLDYLSRLGLNTEVCYCESDANPKGRKRKHEETT